MSPLGRVPAFAPPASQAGRLLFIGAHMTRSSKKAAAAVDVSDLVGEIVLVRSSLWMNGRRKVAAVVTGIEEASFGLGDALAVVSVTAFPPGSPSRTMGDVPLYASEPAAEVVPAAWLRR